MSIVVWEAEQDAKANDWRNAQQNNHYAFELPLHGYICADRNGNDVRNANRDVEKDSIEWIRNKGMDNERAKGGYAVGRDRNAEDHGYPQPRLDVLECFVEMSPSPFSGHDTHLVAS